MNDPQRSTPIAGRYVVETGGQKSTGLTAEQVAGLLESERHADLKIFRIHRIDPSGRMELVGIPRDRFQLEEGILFHFATAADARREFERLWTLASMQPPPCRMKMQSGALGPRHAIILVYPTEYSSDVSAWLQRIGYDGGDHVEGGTAVVTEFYASAVVVERAQLWGSDDGTLARETAHVRSLGA